MPTTDHYTSTNNQPEAEFITPIKQAQQSPTKLLQTSSGSSSRFSVTPLSNECNDDEDHHHQQRTSPVKQTTAAKQPSVEETPTVTQQTLGTHKFCREFRDRYEIKDLLGEGGFGFVVSATREGSDEQVAVKFILKGKIAIYTYTL